MKNIDGRLDGLWRYGDPYDERGKALLHLFGVEYKDEREEVLWVKGTARVVSGSVNQGTLYMMLPILPKRKVKLLTRSMMFLSENTYEFVAVILGGWPR